MLAWQLSNHVWCTLLLEHNSHGFLWMICQSEPALGQIPLTLTMKRDKTFGRQYSHHCKDTGISQAQTARHHGVVNALQQGLSCDHV